jgi:hypothetical protein
MPYSVRFLKRVATAGREPYINECCVGGDVVLEQLLPALRERYGALEPTQEDWGWFAWFERDGAKLAVDVFTHDPQTGEFEIHLTSRQPRILRSAQVIDMPELEYLRDDVVARLQAWPVRELTVERLDEKYRPLA